MSDQTIASASGSSPADSHLANQALMNSPLSIQTPNADQDLDNDSPPKFYAGDPEDPDKHARFISVQLEGDGCIEYIEELNLREDFPELYDHT